MTSPKRPAGCRPLSRSWLVVVLATAWVAVMASSASAAAHFSPCAGEIPGECTRVHVPLDRSGQTPGTVSLLVRRTKTGEQNSPGVVLGIAGGPGQSAITAFGETYVDVLGPLLDGHDFVVADVRGSGRSGALRCPELERARRSERAAAGAACAERLGPRRSYYTTRDTVEDLEAVRHALGVAKLTLFGVSYGTKVALAYAQAHPDHVERVVLDSVVLPEGPDPLYRPSLRALKRVLPALCSAGACRGITRHPWHDVAALATRLRHRALRGRVIGADGRSRRAQVTEADLFALLLDGDEILSLRSDVPSAVHSALRGDARPLLRLTNPDLASRGSDASSGIRFSEALYAATSCEEMPFPWSRTAPISDRPAAVRHALAAEPAGTFAPFGPEIVPSTDFLRVCSRWPVRAAAPTLASGPLPHVPTLVLDGEDDIRTPVEQARMVRDRLPGAQIVTVQAAGHNETGGAVAHCVRLAIGRFARGGHVPARCRRSRTDPVTPVLPRRLRDVSPAPGTSGSSGRTLAAVTRTLADLVVQRARSSERGGGLRGGHFGPARGALSLSQLTLVEGVSVTGRVRGKGRLVARLSIAGRAAAQGTLDLRSDGRLSGSLGGRFVRGQVPRAAIRALRIGG
jgi:pimeloyl-ACP methyl ester carboxylesterase